MVVNTAEPFEAGKVFILAFIGMWPDRSTEFQILLTKNGDPAGYAEQKINCEWP